MFKSKKIPGGVTAPCGFAAAGISANIKGAGGDKKDIALVYSAASTVCAAVYTKNRCAAAPVIWSRRISLKGRAKGVVINSGNANACTGREGVKNAALMAHAAAAGLNASAEEFLVCSTGVIGVPLPVSRIENGIKDACRALKKDLKGGHDAALAIMTTDTFAKETALEFDIGVGKARMGGMAKGSGMIHPDMATMLAVITCDLVVERNILKKALKNAADKSFNMLTVDGDTSTNDSLIILCNGESGLEKIEDEKSAAYEAFVQALETICFDLVKMMAKDGEGATKLLEIEVINAASRLAAAKIAKAVAGSNLVKAAFFGQDANWGRIICAMGYAGAAFKPGRAEISLESDYGKETVMKNGAGTPFSEENAALILTAPEIRVIINLNDGNFTAKAWGCDLTFDYVKINGSYRT